MKRWIDVVEEDMGKRGVVQQNRASWRRRAVKGLANPSLAGKSRQDNKSMMYDDDPSKVIY